ncbi:arabinogalactan protein 12 [Raphanus sativus]|uniref:Arabinogalactan protein 12 n=1 Tax=Raphanus sativus TaxID=3726 RepID=A0A6J0NS75_RAPSA|nr:arabinogalactan protein 12 [Raphanus sativus]
MESMKMRLMVVLMVAIVAFSAVGKAAAQTAEAPAPSPTSDAAMFVPALFASVVALSSGFLF